ncbi:hypothetical protein ACFWGD_07280 [Corynebacterium sp. NPDC060344]|uniref:hypothetical protein n=1 Tax=Corynebacterium sp. NPDC060344 TaxID=3347101 RepID=UPI00365725C5
MDPSTLGHREFWTTAQLKDAGCTQKAIGQFVEAGLLFRIDRGLYSSRRPDALAALRALSWARPRMVFSGPTAAHIYGWGPLTWPAQGRVGRNDSAHGSRLLQLRQSRVGAFRTVGGLRVTTPVATAADLLDRPDAEIRGFLAREYAGVRGNDELERDLRDLGKVDAGRIRALAGAALTGAASSYERRLLHGLRGRGIHAVLNQRIGPFTWDAVIADGRTAVDVDSYAFHAAQGEHASDRTFIVDRWKSNDAFRRGWAPLRYTDSCIDFALDHVLDQIEDTIAFRRSHRRLRTPDELRGDDQPVWAWHPSLAETMW